MTNNEIETKVQHLDSRNHELITGPSEPVSTQPNRQTPRNSPWWVPLLVPAAMTILYVMASIGDHGQPQTERFTLVGDAFAWLCMLATLALPTFLAGVRYNRQHGERGPR